MFDPKRALVRLLKPYPRMLAYVGWRKRSEQQQPRDSKHRHRCHNHGRPRATVGGSLVEAFVLSQEPERGSIILYETGSIPARLIREKAHESDKGVKPQRAKRMTVERSLQGNEKHHVCCGRSSDRWDAEHGLRGRFLLCHGLLVIVPLITP